MADVQEPTTAPAAETVPTNGDIPVTEEPSKTNGDAELTTKDAETAEPQATTDASPLDGNGTAEVDVGATAEATDETATANKNKRKSTGGVPEHKNKKLNKKKSMQQLNLDLVPGDYVWARLKGYAPWPAICCDESMLPESLLGSRPVSTMRPDGSYREDYAEGGKNVRDRTYPVMFLHTNEFAWMPNTSLTRLDPAECEDTEKKKLAVALKGAYKLATEGHDLDYFKDLLRQHDDEQRALEQEQREGAERKAAEAAEKAEKKAEKERRKSKAGDEMDVDSEKPSKKRKKDAGSDGEAPKAKKTPKVKLSAKESQPDSVKKPKTKKKTEEAQQPALSEEERLARREKAVFYLRHKLQRSFLTPNTPPNADEMDEMATHFVSLESHTDLEPQVIRKTKIHKVLKNIVRLENIPREDEFHFKKRSADLLDAWNNALSAGADGDASMLEPASTNGDAKPEEDKSEAPEEEPKAEETAEPNAEETAEPAEAPVETAEPGNAAGDEATDVQMTEAYAETKETADEEKPAEEAPKEEEAPQEAEAKTEE